MSTRSHPLHARGATLVEFVVVVPTLLFMLMSLVQYGLLYHTKGQLNYAAFEAARAGTVQHADPGAIRAAFARAMTGYYGGGTTTAQLAAARARAAADTAIAARIEILSPTKESFDDYHSPALAARLGAGARVIPNANLAFLDCPIDRPGCPRNPAANSSGQTLADANLLKLRITYGIPSEKQIPLAGPFMTRALAFLNGGDSDAFRRGLVAAGRIPVVTHTVMRMQSPAIEAGNASIPGAGNAGKPVDPGPADTPPQLPKCPVTDPACTTSPTAPGDDEGSGSDSGDGNDSDDSTDSDCDPLTDSACEPPPMSCQAPTGSG